MFDVLRSSHSGLRWIVLGLLLTAIIGAAKNLKSGKYEKSSKMINLFTMVVIHLQVTLGAILAFKSQKVQYIDGWMTNPDYKMFRFFGLEHILMMVLAAVLITIGRKKAEKAIEPNRKHKTILIWYVIVLVVIFAAIPWPFRANLGGSWF